MTADEAQIVVAMILGKLEVQPLPLLSWSLRPKRGRYEQGPRFPNGKIAAGPRCWRGEVPALLHEIAHHVAWMRGGDVPRGGFTLRHRKRVVRHGPVFITALRDVAAVWYRQSTDGYPWETEYKSLRAAGDGE